MRALTLGDEGRLTLADVPLPALPHECLIRVTAAGICGTDLQMLEGYADFRGIAGHEFVGVVEDAPASDAHWIGRRVVGEINVGCGTCDRCASGIKEHCPHRTVVGIRDRSGTFAEFLSLPAANLQRVPDHVDDHAAVLVEPIAAACRILEQVIVKTDTRVAVVGDGRLGNLIAQVLSTRTSDLVLIGRREAKLRVARELGIDARTIDGAVPGDYDLVVDATGRPDGLERALELVRPRGTVVLKSTCNGATTMPLWPIPVHEIKIVGSRCGPFAMAIDMLAAAEVKTAPLLAGVFPLESFHEAFDLARREFKVLFDPQART
jgi:threonine dehydrogenase-like Zn-dependent dehydrogenase